MLFTESTERVALMGLGGMGKTQIALELAYRVKYTEKQYSVLWMPAHSAAAFEKAATELVRKLAIPCGTGDDPKEALKGYLASDAAGHWLLILDNVDSMNVLDGFRDGSHGLFDVIPRSLTGRTLLTTRSLEIAGHVAGSDVVELAEMTSHEAHSLLEKSLLDKSQLHQTESVEELLRKLTYLPLTISQAAAYMNVKKLPITAYLRLCNHTNEGMINLLSTYLRDETHYSKTQGAMATTWIVSFTTICEADAGAARLLSFIRWIEPKSIPQSVLPRLDSDWAQTEAIGLLCAYGFLSWQADSKTLDMHSLVHLALRFWLGQSERSLMTKQDAIKHLQKIFPSDKWENRVLWRQYLPHALPLIRGHDLEGCTSSLYLGYWVGRCLHADGRVKEAVKVLQSVVAVQEKTLAEDHPYRLAPQHELAYAYQANGQIKEAITLLQHVVAIREKILAEDHPHRLASQHTLAGAYQANGQIKEAITLLQHVVAIQDKTLAEDHPSRLASQHALARAYEANGQVGQG
jgi:hypothetical protein